jgi:formylglycine-generating enzyme required for sulfatase activity
MTGKQSLSRIGILFGSLCLVILTGCQDTAAAPDRPLVIGPAPTTAMVAGQMRIDGKGIEQVWVPAGTFQMGTARADVDALLALNPPGFVAGEFAIEQPRHEVRLSRGYWIDKFEVTNGAFQAFLKDSGYQDRVYWSEAGWTWLGTQFVDQLPRYCQGNLPENPIACVTWYEAEAYAAWRGGRLPSEAEWEYAARGPESRIYPWGDTFDASLCNVVGGTALKPVGSFPAGASWVGAQDMAGNVMEWVRDWLAHYPEGPLVDPTGPETGKVKVEKGGFWSGTFFVARSAYRHFEDAPDYGDSHIGFRIVSPQ